jgi:Flp pilus assembly protein TadG
MKTRARRFAADRRGNVAIMAALALPALMGTFGLGTEVASWYANQRGMQNAADSAALAAATNAATNYDTEAKAVTAKYGYKDGQNGVAVAVSDTTPCPPGVTNPAGGTNCYSVTISQNMPLVLAQFVGYSGDATVSGAPAKRIRAAAIAVQSNVPRPYCLVTLGQNGITLQANGSPMADLSGCNVMSNGSADCNGHNLNADNGDAHGSNNNCGIVQHNNVPILPDPYAKLATNIPPDNCGGSYPQGPTKKNGVQLSGNNLLSNAYQWSGNVPRCGDLKLTSDVTITNTSGPATLVIYNGDLDLNGHTLSTAPGSQLTIVFAGDNSYSHTPMSSGTLDIEAPTSGPWSGVAMYQAPNITQGVDISAAGNSPTWNITGLVYLPHSHVTFSGAVNKSHNGASCFVMVSDTVTINGTGSILAHGGCGQAGLNMPTNPVPGRAKLVL